MNTQDPAAAIGQAIVGFLNLPQVQLALRLGWLALIAGWATSILWIARDAWHRSGSALLAGAAGLGMTAATPVLFIPAIPVWLLVRPQGNVAEGEERRLTVAALRASLEGVACPGCQARVNASWQRCPWCRTWLQTPCPRCGRLVEPDAQVCPFCVAELPPAVLRTRPSPPSRTPDASPTVPVAVPIVERPRVAIPIEPELDPDAESQPVWPAEPIPAKPRRTRTASRSRRSPPQG